MPRLARTVAVGCGHHITQRGNNRQDVFLVDDDRQVYLELLAEQADKYGLEVGIKGVRLFILLLTHSKVLITPILMPWKVVLASWIKEQCGVTNRWFSETMHMGTIYNISRALTEERKHGNRRKGDWRKLGTTK